VKKSVRNALIAAAVLLIAVGVFVYLILPSSPQSTPDPSFPIHLQISEDPIPHYRHQTTDAEQASQLEEAIRAFLKEGKIEEARQEMMRLKTLPAGSLHPQQLHLLERALEEGVQLRRGESPYTIVSFDGVEGDDLATEALALIDEQLADLAGFFGYMPREKVEVVIYSDPRFASATGMPLPQWVEAGYDGKLRLPVELFRYNEQKEAVIRHELSHAFSKMMMKGALPIWLDEGVAQYLEGRRLPECWPREWDFPPMERMAAPFVQESNPELANILYQSSLALLNHLITLKGWDILQGYFKDLEQGFPEPRTFANHFELTHQQAWADAQISLATQFCPEQALTPTAEAEDWSGDREQIEKLSHEEEEPLDPRLSPEAEELQLYPESHENPENDYPVYGEQENEAPPEEGENQTFVEPEEQHSPDMIADSSSD